MRHRFLGFALTLFVGCSSAPRPFVQVEHAAPLDPTSVRFRLHADGSVECEGGRISTAEMAARTSPSPNERNLTPVLLEPDPEASFVVVRDALNVLIGRASCVNLAFRVATPTGPGTLVLPVLSEACGWWRLYAGRSFVQMTDETHQSERLEIGVTADAGGAIQVKALKIGVPGFVYYPAAGEKAPDPSWKGAHPPFGIWDLDLLKRFLARSEVAARSPYILFEIQGKEKVADVIQSLSRLRSAIAGEIVPLISTGY